MNQKNNGKRRYFQQKSGNANRLRQIEWGTSALYFTVNGDEKRAVNEAKNLLDHHFSQLNKKDNQKEVESKLETAELDVSEELANICQSANNNSGNNRVAFWQIDSGVKNILLFKSSTINEQNVYEFCDLIIEDCQKDLNCRFLARLLPVETCCSCELSILSTTLQTILSKHLIKWPSDEKAPTYAIDFKSRHNNDMVGRQVIFDMVTEIIQTQSPLSKVNLNEPDLLISINVCKKTAYLACIKNYYQRNKLSLRPLNSTENDETKAKNDEKDLSETEISPSKILKSENL